MDQLPAFEDTQPVSQDHGAQDPAELPAFEDTQPVEASSTPAPETMPAFEDTHPVEQYTTPGQQAEAGFEGFARGITGGLSDALASGMRKGASALGVPDEDLHWVAPDPNEMAERKNENPVTATGSEIAGSIPLFSKLPSIGGKVIGSMFKMGLISAGDELSKSVLGEGDSGLSVAAHIAGSSLLGGVTGKLLSKAESAVPKALENSKIGTQINSFLSGLGHAAMFPGEDIVPLASSGLVPEEVSKLSDTSFKMGQNIYKNMGRMAAGVVGNHVDGITGGVVGSAIEKYVEKVFGPSISKASVKIAAPMIMKAAESGKIQNLTSILDSAKLMDKGARAISSGVENIFSPIANKAVEAVSSDREREKLKKFISEGGVNTNLQQEVPEEKGYADGGSVTPPLAPAVAASTAPENPMESVFPAHNMQLNAARARVSQYLHSSMPVSSTGLPFDTVHSDPKKHRDYDKLLDLANQPLSILNHVKDGSLQASHLKAFTAMYPELHQQLSQKMTEQITKHQLKDGKKPPYKTRQALSMFLGSSLDSSLTPLGIQTAQAVFAKQGAQNQGPPPSSKSLSKMGDSSITPAQSREQRLNKN